MICTGGGREVLLHKLMSPHIDTHGVKVTNLSAGLSVGAPQLGFRRDVRVSGANNLQVSMEELSRVLERPAATPLTALKVGKCKVCICV